eukprot:scaffold3296_cov112-Cylindrotheca_fusiformis.AAC.4
MKPRKKDLGKVNPSRSSTKERLEAGGIHFAAKTRLDYMKVHWNAKAVYPNVSEICVLWHSS